MKVEVRRFAGSVVLRLTGIVICLIAPVLAAQSAEPASTLGQLQCGEDFSPKFDIQIH